MLTVQLPAHFINLSKTGGSHGMSFGKQTAAGIDGYLAVYLGEAFLYGRPSFTSFKETDIFAIHNFGNGEAVVNLGDVYI